VSKVGWDGIGCNGVECNGIYIVMCNGMEWDG
jgi:hypothetical protein